MSGPEQFFDARTLEAVLTRRLHPTEPQRILLLLDGPARALASEIRIRTAMGRVAYVRAGPREGARALGIAFLADRGRIETASDPSPGQGGGAWHTPASLLSEARVWASSILELIQGVGGLGAVLRVDEARLTATTGLPDVAKTVARLADGRRTVARLFADAAMDELLVARVIQRLGHERLLTVVGPDDAHDPLLPPPRLEGSQFSMPAHGWGDTSALPETDAEEFEGDAVGDDIHSWLHTEQAPPTLLSEEAFMSAYVSDASAPAAAPLEADASASEPDWSDPSAVDESDAPTMPPRSAPLAAGAASATASEATQRVRQAVPYTTRGPEPADDELFKEAGVSGQGPWLAIGALILLLLLLAFVIFRGEERRRAPDAGMIAPVPTSTITTSTVSTATVATSSVTEEMPSPDGLRPTVAAPDAPELVREAEALVQTERLAEAARLLLRLRKSRPDDPAVFILSGMVYVDTNRLRAAGRMADRALLLDRRSFRAWVLKGSVLQFEQDDEGALRAYQRALKLGPTHPMSDQLRAVVTQLERRAR